MQPRSPTKQGRQPGALERWLLTIQTETLDPPKTESLLRTLRAQEISRTEPSGPGWDRDAQIYLGLVPLRQSLDPATRQDPGLLNELRDRRQRLLAPYETTRAAPETFTPNNRTPRR